MNHAQLSDVQIANLTLLLTIRDGVMQDRLATCCKFALDAAQAERLGTLGIQQIMAIVANVGDATLFPPRRDLIALLDLPRCRWRDRLLPFDPPTIRCRESAARCR